MFFGREEPKKEINLKEFEEFVNDLFNKKIVKLENKALSLITKINEYRKAFIDTCDDFEKLETEPDIEDIGMSNSKQIKISKSIYVLTLKRTLIKINLIQNQKILYHKYEQFFAENEVLLNNILKVNNTFKKVLYCYSNNLDNFKRTFSAYEDVTKHLKNELNKYTIDLDNHNEIIDKYNEIIEKLEEKKVSDNELIIKSSQNSSENQSQKIDKNIETSIKKSIFKISNLNIKISNLKSNINNIFGNLNKTAKKFDYTSKNKIKIEEYKNEYKFKMLSEPKIYEDFLKQIICMKEYINKNKIDIKNFINVKSSLDLILEGKLKEYVDELNILNKDKNNRTIELIYLQNELKKQISIENSKINKKELLKTLNKDINELEEEINKNILSLEKEVYEIYRKKILIIK